MTEEWRDVPGWGGKFRISNEGVLFNVHKGKVIKPTLTNSGYHLCSLSLNGKTQTWTIHRLVLLAFVGECPPGMIVDHINSIRNDNRLSNLEYCTPLENTIRAVRGKKKSGRQRKTRVKLDSAQVEAIISLRRCGLSYEKIGQQFKLSRQTITYIVKHRMVESAQVNPSRIARQKSVTDEPGERETA